MRILFLLRFFPVYGGGESVTLRLAEGFLQQGDIVSIGYLWDNGWEKIQVDDRVTCIRLLNDKNNHKETIAKKYYKEITSKLKNAIESRNIDIIINQWLPPQIVYNANNGLAKIITCRHAAIYINSWKWNFIRSIAGQKFSMLLRYYYRKNLFYSDKWVLLCKTFESQAKKIYKNRYTDKIVSINNPCRYNLPTHVDISSKENMVLYVGRIYEAKRVDDLINIWKETIGQIASGDWMFVIVGDGDEQEKLEHYVSENGIPNIQFVGFQNPEIFYKKASVFVSASETEGYPMAIVEAMAFGCVPIIMNNYESLSDIISEETGIMINGNSHSAFKKNLIQLINNNTERQYLAKNCMRKANQYDLNIIINTWKELFEEMRGNLCL